MRFWLDKGIAGFRMDVINMLAKHPGLPDAPVQDSSSPWQDAQSMYCNQPRVHEYLQEMRVEVLDHYPDIMTVGELLYTTRDEVKLYVEPSRGELDSAFEFPLCAWGFGPGGRFDKGRDTIQDLKQIICRTWKGIRGNETAWQTFFLESHDTARSVTRFGDRSFLHSVAVAKMLAVLSNTLNGTLFVYQGQEIGMENYTAHVPIDQFDDINTVNALRAIEQRRRLTSKAAEVVDMSDVHEEIRLKARDHTRSPMPWDDRKPHAGFSDTTGTLWKRMIRNTDRIDVESQDADASSVLNFWRTMITFRRMFTEEITYGRFMSMPTTTGETPVLAYMRYKDHHLHPINAPSFLVVLNMSGEDRVPYTLPNWNSVCFQAMVGTRGELGFAPGFPDSEPLEGGSIVLLGPFQASVYETLPGYVIENGSWPAWREWEEGLSSEQPDYVWEREWERQTSTDGPDLDWKRQLAERGYVKSGPSGST